ncbi:MAG: hypothetical protein ACK5LC_00290 [Coprobacillaceae bacterium]
MPIEITQVGGFIPQANIKISDSRPKTILSNIKIERKEAGGEFITIIVTDSDTSTYSYTDINEFGKTYTYRVSADVVQEQQEKVTGSTSYANYWKQNYTLSSGVKIDSGGWLYGTGYATATATYLKNMNSKGQHNIDFSCRIGNGGSKDGKYNADYNNIIFRFRAGVATTVDRLLYINKSWSNTAYNGARKYWFLLQKRGMDGKRIVVKDCHDSQNGFDLEIYFKNAGSSGYNYGYSGNTNFLNGVASGFGYKGGICRLFRIEIKNGAMIRPDRASKAADKYITVFKTIQVLNKTETLTVTNEPDVDYGIIINEKGEGFRFNRFEPNGLLDSDNYETKSISQMLDIQDSKYPLVYVNDNKKTPSTNITILTSNLAYRNRMRNRVIESNYIYIYVPKSWNYQIINGFYAYETVSEERLRYTDDLYYFHFNDARRVLSSMVVPPEWTYDALRVNEVDYVSVPENYRDYADLAVSPAGTEVLGESKGDD